MSIQSLACHGECPCPPLEEVAWEICDCCCGRRECTEGQKQVRKKPSAIHATFGYISYLQVCKSTSCHCKDEL